MNALKCSLGILIFMCGSLKSQSVHYGGVFPTIDHSGNLTDKLNYNLYYFGAFPLIHLKKANVTTDANFLLFYSEQSLTYLLKNNFSITGSYVYQRANVVYNNYVNENRIYIQGKYKHVLGKINFTHRLRYDFRFIKNRITHKTPFTHRLRYLIGIDVQIKEKLYFTAYEEAFFNTVSKASPVYEENWAYAALGVKLNKKNKIETGILYITWNTGKTNWFNQYYLQLTWINHLDFRKSKL